jgi:hypothetical protein
MAPAEHLLATLVVRALTAAAPDPHRSRDELALVRIAVYYDSEERRHHFFPRHLAVVDGLVRIGLYLLFTELSK